MSNKFLPVTIDQIDERVSQYQYLMLDRFITNVNDYALGLERSFHMLALRPSAIRDRLTEQVSQA
jgi:hypothetical protein